MDTGTSSFGGPTLEKIVTSCLRHGLLEGEPQKLKIFDKIKIFENFKDCGKIWLIRVTRQLEFVTLIITILVF